VGFLAFGLFLILLGAGLSLAPAGPFFAVLETASWISLAIGAVLVVVHVAMGPRPRRRLIR
jgi:hypothetical protein